MDQKVNAANSRNAAKTFSWLVALLQLCAIDFVVCGGLAAKSYGSTRPLNDIDIDVANADVAKLHAVVAEHAIFGPDRYRDDNWDVLLMRLNHEGQMIDVSGGDDARIYNPNRKVWIAGRTDFRDIEWRKILGIVVPVMAPTPLMSYKSLLTGADQQRDVRAIRRFIASENDGISAVRARK